MRIALIKTSSMGDVVHALPVVTDLRCALPNARIDWVVEEAFADLPALHPGVEQVLPIALRRWRRAWWSLPVRRERREARRRLSQYRYDCVLDLQGLYKSVMVAGWMRGPRVGFSFSSAREPLAALAYSRRYRVDMQSHAIERLRSLAGQAFGYPVEGLPRFELAAPPIDPALAAALAIGAGSGGYFVLLHATSRAEKEWPIERWQALIARLGEMGLRSILPWGSNAEHERARMLADASPNATVAPRMRLRDCASLIAGADGVVGVDTGLTHLAAAFDVPTAALFASTPAWRFGPYWSPRVKGLGSDGHWPATDEVLATLQTLGAFGASKP
ncbi:MAG: lipopolysaccharide heptosyltransferase I [Burkholderiaceae bacterium]